MAQKLCVTPRTLENWMREGFVPYIKIGRCVRYDLEDVMAALKRRHGRNMSSDAFRV